MANYFSFDGVNSTTYNTYIAKSNMFDAPEEDVEAISIPGSNRIVYLHKGCFKPFTITAECYIPSGMQSNVDDLRNFLKSRAGECRYYESLKPSEYRLATFIEAFNIGSSDRKGAAFTLQFTARPERFLVSGDIANVLTADGTVTNPTLFPSRPLIRIYGTGTVDINGQLITVNTVDGYVDIDFDTMQAYKGSTNCNNNVEFSELTLQPGVNNIDLTTVSKVEIKGRWFTL
ncbi:MAG: hypothetical protein IKE94_08915 [Aeriscardovia sp.]|nr:hypothetical protein [Aeriscardovia sp.]